MNRTFYTLLLSLFLTGQWAMVSAQAPCNLSNSSGCDCKDGSNDCDLLPDMTVAKILLESASNNPETPGELGVSVSSPNIGHGPLRIIATDYYVCGYDTIYEPGGFVGNCTSTGEPPRQLIMQRIYHKNPSGTMTYTDRWAGSMTYHASHGHMHVDDWGKYSLRNEIPGTDPLTWPIVAEGAKLGFCLMDFGSCQYYNGHCVTNDGTVLTTDAPNYGLGGGSYSCGLTNQGISAGYTDIYYYYLDGMQIPIPASVCNGSYKLVVHLDPYDYFLEEDETNNVEVVDVVLTQQGGGSISIVPDGPTAFCEGGSVTLSIDAPATSYLWSNGATSPSITVSGSTSVSCTAVTTCGMQTTPTVSVNVTPAPAPVGVDGTSCGPGTVDLSASGSGTLHWYSTATGGSPLATGTNYTTPTLTASTTYYVESESGSVGATHNIGQVNHTGTSLYNGSTINSHLIFNALEAFTLESVKVYTDQAGLRRIELRNSSGSVLQSANVNIPAGESRVTLNFSVPAGSNLQLGTNSSVNTSSFGDVSPELRRSSSGVSMPYVVADVASIFDTPYGNTYYYYFYDWAIREADDICVSVRTPVQAIIDNSPTCGTCSTPASVSVSGITATSATVSWTSAGANATGYQVQGRKAGTSNFRQTQTGALSYTVTNLKPSTSYEWYVRARCDDASLTAFTPLNTFTTAASRLSGPDVEMNISPNPNTGFFQISLDNVQPGSELSIQNLLGQVLWSGPVAVQDHGQYSLSPGLAPGLYLVRLQGEGTDIVQRLIIEQ